MTVYQSMILIISFGSLITVLLIFANKNNHPI
ncbi:putative holin-like toxin [Virgibacillus sp. FSP13]